MGGPPAASHTAVSATETSLERVRVDGRFFRAGAQKFHPRGVAYGPFAPGPDGAPYPAPEQVRRDFAQMRELGANLVRVYTVPPAWFLDLAAAHGLRVWVDVPWNQHARCVDRPDLRAAVRDTVRRAAGACGRHPALFALSVANELPADVVRWSGAAATEAFLDELVAVAREQAPECLCTFGNYPTTEFLRPRAVDFVCFNVYLHQPRVLRHYLARLQTLAAERPLVLGEFGMDARREGPERQAELVGWTIETAFRAGLAGVVAYSFTDEWFKDGRWVEDWQFGLTDRARRPRPAFAAARRAFAAAPYFPLPATPPVSVVVASFNGARTLPACLESLRRLNYPNYEVLLVDDGSTDQTPALAARFPGVRWLRHERNLGLSTARNTGIAAARGEVIAFTDADCRADEDWLYYTVAELLESGAAGVGGPNLLPPDDSWVAAAVMVSPGGPAPVLLTDREAEHVPGCNMVFWKRALLEVGGFDPQFRRAGDDVDLCWRLRQQGGQIAYSHAGFVWHARRSTVRAYLRQQYGYGEAEALLARKHPEYFNPLGGSLWQGRIYAPATGALWARRAMIYHGRFGSAPFQSLYQGPPAYAVMALTSLEYHVLVTLPLLVLGAAAPGLLSLGVASALLSLTVCGLAAWQAELPPRRHVWSRPLVALLHFLQPVVRGWARYRHRLVGVRSPLARLENLDSLSRQQQRLAPREVVVPDPAGRGRAAFLETLLARLESAGWQFRVDSGWREFDLEVYGRRWSKLRLTTLAEHAPDGPRLWCRLQTCWTLPARVVWGAVALLSMLGVLAWAERRPWAWALLLLPPALAWGLARDQQSLRRVFGVFLERVAASWAEATPRSEASPGASDITASGLAGPSPGAAG